MISTCCLYIKPLKNKHKSVRSWNEPIILLESFIFAASLAAVHLHADVSGSAFLNSPAASVPVLARIRNTFAH